MLKELLLNRGIIHYGISSPEQYNIEGHFKNRDQKSNFEHDLEKRLKIEDYFEGCQSILSVLVPYPVHRFNVSQGNGKITSMAWGHDYHKTVKELLQVIVTDLKSTLGEFDYKFHVDSGPLVDRELAVNGGLGFFGKNQFVIHPEGGLNVYIGHLLLNVTLEDDSIHVSGTCGTCSNCIKACPSKALDENYIFHPNRCISELSQKKEHLTIIEMQSLGMNLYGCDVCQLVCPYLNEQVSGQLYSNELPQIELEKIMTLSNKDFKNLYKESGFFWRGLRVIKRNAIIAMGNSKDEKYLEILKSYSHKVSDYHKRYIIYAIISIKSKSKVDLLPILTDNDINGILNDYEEFVKNI